MKTYLKSKVIEKEGKLPRYVPEDLYIEDCVMCWVQNKLYQFGYL